MGYVVLFFKVLAFLMLPGLFWLYLFSGNPKLFNFPRKALIPVFAMGILVSIPAITIEYFCVLVGKLVETKQTVFITTFFIIAPVEEYLKSLAVDIAGYHRNEKGTPVQILSWYCAAAVGFASIENVLYFLVFGSEVFLFRLLITTIAHVGCSGIIALFIGRHLKRTGRLGGFTKGYLIAFLLHGAYDFCLNIYPVTIWFWVPLFLVGVCFLETLLDDDPEDEPGDEPKESVTP